MRKCDNFFALMEASGLAVTYDEVRLRTGYSCVLPSSVSLRTKFSRELSLNIPIVSAAMDTVTESGLAIALAKLGGIGVIHRNLSPEQQQAEIWRVKHHLSGLIESPITVLETMTLRELQEMLTKLGLSFHTFPVVTLENKLVGVISQSDLDFCDNLLQTAADTMTRREYLITAQPGISIDDAYEKMKREKKRYCLSLTMMGISRECISSVISSVSSRATQQFSISIHVAGYALLLLWAPGLRSCNASNAWHIKQMVSLSTRLTETHWQFSKPSERSSVGMIFKSWWVMFLKASQHEDL